MIAVTYIERRFIDRFTCIDTEQTIKALSSFIQGDLTYFRMNRFNYKVIETDLIKSIKEV
jgi:hypothetical protein|nr:MAG TPA: hypothetical protein [Caudoviricetes sp.]